jgi:hypothetical protein
MFELQTAVNMFICLLFLHISANQEDDNFRILHMCGDL